jgi:hypothetical protein
MPISLGQLPLASGAELSGHVCDVDGGRAFKDGGGGGGCSADGGVSINNSLSLYD